jgi:hypothetical protein
MNAFCASENCDAFIVFHSSQPRENTAENSNSERSSFRGADQVASKAGPLSGNHFLTLTEGLENLHTLGRKTLLEGQQDIRFELA